jgi:hypothetical protein
VKARDEGRQGCSIGDDDLVTDELKKAFENASRMMRDAGFQIDEEIDVVVDRKLPFMGYTTTRGQEKHTIVVSAMALDSGMVEGLLIHEMSHIYRTVTKHPSHDQSVISSVISPLVKKGLNKDFQLQALHAGVNHIQDLYADDVSFEVFKRSQSKLFSLEQMSEFFLSWLKDEPVRSDDVERSRWMNASIMLNNTFALSNMERHGIPDRGNRASKLNDSFLARIAPQAAQRFDYFHKLMVSLKEEISETEFKDLLGEYSANFLTITRAI